MNFLPYPDKQGRCIASIENELFELLPELATAVHEVAALVAPDDASLSLVQKIAEAAYRDMLEHIRDSSFVIESFANASSGHCFAWCPRSARWKLYWRHIHACVVGWRDRLAEPLDLPGYYLG